MLYLGIDEAGRGPVFGPLVLSTVGFSREKLFILEYFDIKDSKKLSEKRRKNLYKLILDEADFVFLSILQADVIDYYVFNSSLNKLELEYMSNSIKPFLDDILINNTVKVFIDSPEKPDNFKQKIINNLKIKRQDTLNLDNLIVENKADDKFKIVGAASILAKVTRDNIIENLKKEFGEIGSGYPSDSKTTMYLNSIDNIYNPPYFVRKSWKTYTNITNSLF